VLAVRSIAGPAASTPARGVTITGSYPPRPK
jgi:hypothetical protein